MEWSYPTLPGHIFHMACGIYKIVNVSNGKFYVGSSKDIASRWKAHITSLKAGIHHSRYLQASWNLYGSDSFEINVLEYCDEARLLEREQYYIDSLMPQYNISLVAGKPPPPPNKPIERIDIITGESVEFRTRDEAAASGPFNEGSITACCLGHMGKHGGYYWIFADGSTPEFISAKRELPVERISSDSEVVAFPSAYRAAAITTGATQSSISACCLGNLDSHAGYKWRYADNSNLKLALNIARLTGVDGYGSYTIRGTVQNTVYRNSVDSSSRISTVGRPTPIDRIEFGTCAMKRYESMAAAESDGFDTNHISSCCRGERNSHGGYAWKFADVSLSEEDVSKIKKSKPRKINRRVRRIDVASGEEVFYENVSSVTADGFSMGNVISCCSGKRKSHKGFFWEYEDSPLDRTIKERGRAVAGRCVDTGEVKVYSTLAAVAADGFSPTKVSLCCLGRRHVHKGYSWRHQ